MTNLSDEQLSSFLDGELDDTQQKEAIEALGSDDKARERWHRHHLVSDAMHGNLPDGIDLQFSARVMAAIDDEPAILAPLSHGTSSSTLSETSAPPASVTSIDHASPSSSFSKRFAGLAVAASVAAVAVMGVETFYRADPAAPANQKVAAVSTPQIEFARLAKQTPVPATLASVKAPAIQATTVSTRSGVYAARQDAARRIDPRLHKYLINHSQQATRSNLQGAMPYARIVTYAGMHQQSVQR